MKTLKRITLKNVSEYLSDQEMRKVVGGYDLPGVVVYGTGTPCNGVGIVFGNCAGSSAQVGDQCDYIITTPGGNFHISGRCGGNGSLMNATTNADYTILGSNGLTCLGNGNGVPCSQSYF